MILITLFCKILPYLLFLFFSFFFPPLFSYSIPYFYFCQVFFVFFLIFFYSLYKSISVYSLSIFFRISLNFTLSITSPPSFVFCIYITPKNKKSQLQFYYIYVTIILQMLQNQKTFAIFLIPERSFVVWLLLKSNINHFYFSYTVILILFLLFLFLLLKCRLFFIYWLSFTIKAINSKVF